VHAVVVPHAGYVYSGPIAGCGYRTLRSLAVQSRTVLLMGPAHRVPVSGIAVGDFAAFRTPLGVATVEQQIVARLTRAAPWFGADRYAHLPEHSLEVQVPFLQVLWGDAFSLAPLLCGRADPEAIAAILLDIVVADPEIVTVVSSDLSHYHPYETARRLDQEMLAAIERDDPAAVAEGEACGVIPILILMAMARELRWKAHILDSRSSGDTAGDRERVVGYAAIAYTD
jgi:AmmeMemoRadiSam system protein B